MSLVSFYCLQAHLPYEWTIEIGGCLVLIEELIDAKKANPTLQKLQEI